MKRGIKNITLLLLAIAGFYNANAQELKCQVQVNAQKINGVDPAVFTNMQTTLNEFMNTRAWTSDVFGSEEKIECSVFIFIDQSTAQDVYNAKITVQSSRPVFNSSYSTPMFNYIDNDCILTYVQNQTLDLNPNQFTSNLTSIMAFYAYMIIGMDYESYSKGGGAKYFALAEQIMNAVPTNAPDARGWRPFDGTRNRYWMINNIQAGKYDVFKQALYSYHYAGMDNFYDKPELARKNISNAIDMLDKIFSDNPNAILLNMFFQAKSDELVGVFSNAESSEKAKVVNELKKLDPTNANKYDKITKSN